MTAPVAASVGVQVEYDDAVATVSLARPSAKNALTEDMQVALGAIVSGLRRRDDVRAVIFRGEGGVFCAGADAKGMGAGLRERPPHNQAIWSLMERQRNLVGELWELPQPTIAVLEGPVVGAGLSLALACDLRYAAPDAYLMAGFMRMGLPGDYGVTWLLTKLVGPSRAKELLYFSEQLPAPAALAMGLVNGILDRDALLPHAQERAHRLSGSPMAAIRYLKQNIARAQSTGLTASMEVEALASLASTESPEYASAIEAFLSRRRNP